MSHTLTKITLPAVDGGEERDLTIIGTAHISEESVKEVGSYKAVLKLHKEVSVEIPFEVVSE